jgi:hypothetical protein
VKFSPSERRSKGFISPAREEERKIKNNAVRNYNPFLK